MNTAESEAIIAWVFLVLAVLTAGLASGARTRSHLRWGRTGTSVPMSGFGAAAWVGAFLLISAAGFQILPLMVIFLVIPLLAVAGCYDSHRQRRVARAGDAPRRARQALAVRPEPVTE